MQRIWVIFLIAAQICLHPIVSHAPARAAPYQPACGCPDCTAGLPGATEQCACCCTCCCAESGADDPQHSEGAGCACGPAPTHRPVGIPTPRPIEPLPGLAAPPAEPPAQTAPGAIGPQPADPLTPEPVPRRLALLSHWLK